MGSLREQVRKCRSADRRDERATKQPVEDTPHKKRAAKEKPFVVEYMRTGNTPMSLWLWGKPDTWIVWKRYATEKSADQGLKAAEKFFAQWYERHDLGVKFQLRVRNVKKEPGH